jgi:FMN phosphatase YigB (HAD superfamily)
MMSAAALVSSNISTHPHLLRSIIIIFAVIVSTSVLVSATSSQLSMLTLSSAAACCRTAVSLVTIGGGRCSSSSITAFARQQQYAPQLSSTLSFITPVVRGKSAFTTRRHDHPVSMTRLHQNMGFSSSSSDESSRSNNNNIDETSKWENMYNNYQPQSTTTTTATTPSNNNNSIPKSEIRIITFDLDNTIWKTSDTISHANTVLSSTLLDKFGIEVRSEVEMGRLFKEFPDRYCGLLTAEHDDFDDGGGRDDSGGTKVDGERSNNGGRGEEESSSDDEYANSVQNVGQTEASSLGGATITEGIDTGVHIQPTQIGKAKKKPVYLTLLRKDAIRSLILQQQQQQQQQQSDGGDNKPLLSPVELEAEVEDAFNLWMKARSQSISNNFAYNAVETLFRLKSQLAATTKKVYIGAITDGNSNPQSVPELSNLFDFVIRAEDVGVSKPDKRVYKAAVGQVMAQLMMDGRSAEDFFLGTESGDDSGGSVGVDASYLISESRISGGSGSGSNSLQGGQSLTWKDIDPEAVEAFSDAVGPWWVHIGDDFFKDIVAAKEFRMRSVWVRELIGGAEAFGGGSGAPSPGGKNKRSVEDLVNDIAKNDGPVKMEIGESGFLTSALHEEFSDAILDRFADLGDLLIQWNVEGSSGSKDEEAFIKREEVENVPDTILQKVEMATTSASSSEDLSATKFCIFCGEKVPVVAKFCPGCGERQ